jgi:hypothetical protein
LGPSEGFKPPLLVFLPDNELILVSSRVQVQTLSDIFIRVYNAVTVPKHTILPVAIHNFLRHMAICHSPFWAEIIFALFFVGCFTIGAYRHLVVILAASVHFQVQSRLCEHISNILRGYWSKPQNLSAACVMMPCMHDITYLVTDETRFGVMREKHSSARVFLAVKGLHGRQEACECYPVFQVRALSVVALVVWYIGLANDVLRMWIAELCMLKHKHKRFRFGLPIHFI